ANGHDLYAWCAADTISFPSLLNHTAVIESPDPISGEIVRLTVTPDGVEGLNPSSAVVSWSLESDLDNIRGSFCNLTHYFTSRETAAQYVSDRPGLVIVPVDSVFEAANMVRGLEGFRSLVES
ncbi:MAG: organomercurial lyase, partial [Anaerolineales bacterium]